LITASPVKTPRWTLGDLSSQGVSDLNYQGRRASRRTDAEHGNVIAPPIGMRE
jgi:hypothetical protein